MTKKGGEKLTFEQKLKEKADAQLEWEKLDTLPVSIEAMIHGEPEFKQDARQQECMYLVLKLKNGKGVKQKYTKTTWKAIYDAITKAGGLAELQKNWHFWSKQEKGQAQKDRYYPESKKA